MSQLVTLSDGTKCNLTHLKNLYEAGDLSLEDSVRLIALAMKHGQAWEWPGFYTLAAKALFECGIVTSDGDLVDGWRERLHKIEKGGKDGPRRTES